MSADTIISWCNATFNPWEGCSKVSPGCAHCYAEARNRRFAKGANWGPGAPRRRTAAANWKQPVKWNNEQREKELLWQGLRNYGDRSFEKPLRPRVFCASLADWLDRITPNLDWLLLTKRPENFSHRVVYGCGEADWGNGRPPSNVWLGTTVEDQQRADERIPLLLSIPAKVRFLSCEPLLGAVDLLRAGAIESDGAGGEGGGQSVSFTRGKIDWVICGGESGPKARPMCPTWANRLKTQCQGAGVAFWMKQMGGTRNSRHELSDIPEDLRIRELP